MSVKGFCILKFSMRATVVPSSETQGQPVGSGEKVGRKFSSTGKRAPGYRLSPNYFQKFKQMPAPDWAQKMLCIIVPSWRTVPPEFFSWVRTRRLLSFYLYCYFLPILLFQKWPKLKFDKFPSYKTPSIVSLRNRKKRTAKRMCVTIATWLSLACFVVIFTWHYCFWSFTKRSV